LEEVAKLKAPAEKFAPCEEKEVVDEEIDASILALLENAGPAEHLPSWELCDRVAALDWAPLRPPSGAKIVERIRALEASGRVEVWSGGRVRLPISRNTPFKLELIPSDAEKKNLCRLGELLLASKIVSGNKYKTVEEIAVDAIHRGVMTEEEGVENVQKIMEVLKKEKKVKPLKQGNVVMWKKVYLRPRTAMKNGSWKKMIVSVLDAVPGLRMTHGGLLSSLKERFPEECSRVTDLHGAVGSAMDRLLKDKKFQRIRVATVGKVRHYYTEPVGGDYNIPF